VDEHRGDRELVQSVLEAWNRADYAAVLEHVAPEIKTESHLGDDLDGTMKESPLCRNTSRTTGAASRTSTSRSTSASLGAPRSPSWPTSMVAAGPAASR
jgi:ketosteroid isomerase-like protein